MSLSPWQLHATFQRWGTGKATQTLSDTVTIVMQSQEGSLPRSGGRKVFGPKSCCRRFRVPVRKGQGAQWIEGRIPGVSECRARRSREGAQSSWSRRFRRLGEGLRFWSSAAPAGSRRPDHSILHAVLWVAGDPFLVMCHFPRCRIRKRRKCSYNGIALFETGA
jgi:hypothetical protein